MEKPYQCTFPNELTADVIQVHHCVDLPQTLHDLGFSSTRPILVLVGGASGISPADLSCLEQLFVDAIAPIAEELGVIVVDGGTDAGIMKFIGLARTKISGTFPLIGVAAIGTVILPNVPPPMADAAPLEPHHTHFVLVPGSNWGDESPWIASIANVLSGEFPSVTVVVNGGEITLQDVSNSLKAHRPVVTLDGSGRTADKLAAALRGEPTDSRAQDLVASGQVESIKLNQNSGDVSQLIREKLSKLLRIQPPKIK